MLDLFLVQRVNGGWMLDQILHAFVLKRGHLFIITCSQLSHLELRVALLLSFRSLLQKKIHYARNVTRLLMITSSLCSYRRCARNISAHFHVFFGFQTLLSLVDGLYPQIYHLDRRADFLLLSTLYMNL